MAPALAEDSEITTRRSAERIGFSNEEIHLFLATGISDVTKPEVDEDERIDIEVRPLTDLDTLIAEVKDSKTLIALLKLKVRGLGA